MRKHFLVAASLAALAALWVAARVLVLTPYTVAAALANVAFPLAAAVALAVPFWKAKNRRNYFFVGLLLLLAAAAGFVHLAQRGIVSVPGGLGIKVGPLAPSVVWDGRDARGRSFSNTYRLEGAATAMDAAALGCARLR